MRARSSYDREDFSHLPPSELWRRARNPVLSRIEDRCPSDCCDSSQPVIPTPQPGVPSAAVCPRCLGISIAYTSEQELATLTRIADSLDRLANAVERVAGPDRAKLLADALGGKR